MINKNFTVAFWIRLIKNPKWGDVRSDINFPPITNPDSGSKIFFMKHKKNIKVYVLHPEYGYKKLVANIEKYINSDAYVTVTNSETSLKLYINGETLGNVDRKNFKGKLEVGDYVMIQPHSDDLKTFTYTGDHKVVLTAKVTAIKTNSLKLLVVDIPSFEETELPRNRVVF